MRGQRLLSICVIALYVLSACSTSAGRLGEPGTLHAAEIVEIMTRTDILASHGVHESLTNSGVSDSAIVDGSVVVVRSMCCGPPSTANPHGVLNPQGLSLHAGDVIEFVIPGGSSVNTLTRVLQKAGATDGQCWWEPRDDKLWRRVMFCSWMPQQGWVQQTGSMVIGWYKPSIATTANH
jgi:hypothetical protein